MKFYPFLLLFFALLWSCSSPEQQKEGADVSASDTTTVIENREYGFPVDSFVINEGRVKRNENLSHILSAYNIGYETIDALAKKAKSVFDVRHIRAGNKYKIFCDKDSANTMQCFVYEQNPIEYVVFDVRDSVAVYKGQKEVVTKTNTASGVITSSLYETMLDNNIKPILALDLSEMYAWQIDFFRIQKGDLFKVVFEERYIEEELIGYGKILAAYFEHGDKAFYGIRFVQDSVPDYFDEHGNSLRKAFLKAPLRYSRISSTYSRRRFHPVLKRYRAHLGVDYAAPYNTPIYAVGDGTVIAAGYTSGNGNYVKIRHNSMYTTGYLHMTRIAKGIKKGTKVKQKQLIGYVGSTGLATGPHVCFRFYKNGYQVNPLTVEVPPSKPVKETYKDAYFEKRDAMIKVLDSIPVERAELSAAAF